MEITVPRVILFWRWISRANFQAANNAYLPSQAPVLFTLFDVSQKLPVGGLVPVSPWSPWARLPFRGPISSRATSYRLLTVQSVDCWKMTHLQDISCTGHWTQTLLSWKSYLPNEPTNPLYKIWPKRPTKEPWEKPPEFGMAIAPTPFLTYTLIEHEVDCRSDCHIFFAIVVPDLEEPNNTRPQPRHAQAQASVAPWPPVWASHWPEAAKSWELPGAKRRGKSGGSRDEPKAQGNPKGTKDCRGKNMGLWSTNSCCRVCRACRFKAALCFMFLRFRHRQSTTNQTWRIRHIAGSTKSLLAPLQFPHIHK